MTKDQAKPLPASTFNNPNVRQAVRANDRLVATLEELMSHAEAKGPERDANPLPPVSRPACYFDSM